MPIDIGPLRAILRAKEATLAKSGTDLRVCFSRRDESGRGNLRRRIFRSVLEKYIKVGKDVSDRQLMKIMDDFDTTYAVAW